MDILEAKTQMIDIYWLRNPEECGCIGSGETTKVEDDGSNPQVSNVTWSLRKVIHIPFKSTVAGYS